MNDMLQEALATSESNAVTSSSFFVWFLLSYIPDLHVVLPFAVLGFGLLQLFGCNLQSFLIQTKFICQFHLSCYHS
jgi:hypothetical protein